MKRSGFTMIELIFVIVILGILAAVALPKFIGVSEQANVGKLKGYVGTLNRTVGPALWSQSITQASAGSVSGMSANLLTQITTPTIGDAANTLEDPNLASCAAAGTAVAVGVGTVSDAILGGTTYQVGCIDGGATAAPQFFLDDGTTVIVQ